MVAVVLWRMLLEMALRRHLAIAQRQEHVALAVEGDLAAEVAAAAGYRLEQLLGVTQPIVLETGSDECGGRGRWLLGIGLLSGLLRIADVQQPVGGEIW